MSNNSIRELWNVETDATDWPTNLPASDRADLEGQVAYVLAERGPLTLFDLERAVARRCDSDATLAPTYRSAALWGYRYACVERAARATDAIQVWKLDRTSGDLAQAAQALLDAMARQAEADAPRGRTATREATRRNVETARRDLAAFVKRAKK